MTLNSVYYSGVVTWTEEYAKKYVSAMTYTAFLKHYEKEQYDVQFRKFFYDVYRNKPGVYVFIVTNEQLPFFIIDIESVGMDKNLIRKVEPAVNYNYPENGFNLNMFIYKFTKDDHV
jgi:hypothetical protein